MARNNECVYNLVPDKVPGAVKAPRHKSVHDPLLATTASTFVTKSISGTASNTGGDLTRKVEKKEKHATFGKPLGAYKPNTQELLKKQSRKPFVSDLNEMKREKPSALVVQSHKKEAILPPVPLRHETPVMGLKTDKDFVVSNAVDVILSSAAKTQDEVRYVNKKDYGKTPEYINEIKMDNFIMKERQRILSEKQAAHRESEYMSDEQRKELLTKLQNSYNDKMKEYQSFSHHHQLNTIAQVKRKEVLEKELAEIEKGLAVLQNRKIILTGQ